MTQDAMRVDACPFCKGEAKYQSQSAYDYGCTNHWVKCTKCFASGAVIYERYYDCEIDAKRRAISVWNTRAHQSREAEVQLLKADLESSIAAHTETVQENQKLREAARALVDFLYCDNDAWGGYVRLGMDSKDGRKLISLAHKLHQALTPAKEGA